MKQEYCHCGRPLHYSDPGKKKTVESLNKSLGAYMKVSQAGHEYMIQRHYAVLHGLEGKNFAELGFKKVPHQ